VDNVREVIIAGLSIMPVRDRYKVFIIDEVHMLSGGSFNALLKSIEEPPPHVVFMMATTELEKIPETVLSRSQVYEFRTITTRSIAEQLRRIVDADGVTVGDDSLQLIARDAEGSMRDAQSKLDQVIAFTGSTIGSDDAAAVLGLVGRDLVLDAAEAVAGEDSAAAFALVSSAVEAGSDLRLVCRELSRLVRDLLVLSIDPARASDPEIAGEAERDRLMALTKRFSREDLLRAFDLLTKAETDIRSAAQPRYHLEMALLRWIYLRSWCRSKSCWRVVGERPRPGGPRRFLQGLGEVPLLSGRRPPHLRQRRGPPRPHLGPKALREPSRRRAPPRRRLRRASPAPPARPPTSRTRFSPRFAGRRSSFTTPWSHRPSAST
jgi:DNA polymerase-3 subunit gamma/tau